MNAPSDTEWANRPEAELKADFPSVELAYDVAIGSYATLAGRYQAVEGRLQSILGWMIGFTMGTVGFVRGLESKPDFTALFWVAMGVFAVAMLTAAKATVAGSLELLSPRCVYPAWADADEWTFKMNMVMRASDDFVTNLTAIDRKAKAAEIVTSLFALEAILLIVWSATF